MIGKYEESAFKFSGKTYRRWVFRFTTKDGKEHEVLSPIINHEPEGFQREQFRHQLLEIMKGFSI